MRILVLRLAAIGDSLLTFPVLRVLREKYTSSHLTLVGNPAVLPLAKAWGIANDVYDPSQIPWEELYYSEAGIQQKFLKDLVQQADYTICWFPQRNIEEFVKRNLLNAGARKVAVARWGPNEGSQKHMVEYLAETIGLSQDDLQPIPSFHKLGNGFRRFAAPIAIHPGCSVPDRTWPAKSFAKVINRLLRLDQPVLLLAGPTDDEALKKVQKYLSPSPKPGMITILKNAPLLELAHHIGQCKCYLGNDSGITHLAALQNIPTIALFLPRYAPYTHPVGASVEVIQAEPLEKISVERVFESVQKYI